MVPWHGTHPRKKTTKRGDFCHRLVGLRDLQKGGIFTKKGRCLTEDTPVMPRCSGQNTYIRIFNTHFP